MAESGAEMREVKQINLVFILTVAVYLGVSLVVGLFQDKISFVQLILLSQAGLAFVPVAYALKRGQVRERIGFKKLDFGTVLLVLAFILCLEPFLTFLNALSQCFVDTPTTSLITEQVDKLDFVTMFLVVALLPAVLEEFVYRGVFFHAYGKVAVFPGAVLSGLLFGVMHGNLNQFTYAFFMGFFFSLAVYATGSLFASMIMHLFVNGVSIVLLYAFPKLVSEAGETAETTLTVSYVLKSYSVPACVGVGLALLLLRAISERCGTKAKLKAELKRKGKVRAFCGLFTAPLLIAVLLMFGIMILSEVLTGMLPAEG